MHGSTHARPLIARELLQVVRLGFFGRTAWPIVAGVPEALRDAVPGVGLALGLGALYLVYDGE